MEIFGASTRWIAKTRNHGWDRVRGPGITFWGIGGGIHTGSFEVLGVESTSGCPTKHLTLSREIVNPKPQNH